MTPRIHIRRKVRQHHFVVAGIASAAMVLTLAAGAACASSLGKPAPPGNARSTHDVSLYVSATGSDAAACSLAAPCASFNHAYDVAPCGATVNIAPGSYAAQTIAYQAAKESCSSDTRVSFEPSGGRVTVAALTFGAANTNGPKHILVDGIASSDFVTVWPASDDIYLRNLTAMSASIFGASNVTVKGGSYGPCSADASHPSCVFKIADEAGAGGVHYNPSNITVDGASIHDFTTTDADRYHVECVYIVAGGPITIKNSKIYRCQVFGLFSQDYNSGFSGNTPPHDVRIVNNWFGSIYNDQALTQPRNTSIYLDPRGNSFANWIIAFNSFFSSPNQGGTGSVVDADPAHTTGLNLTGNLMANIGCIAGANYTSNLLVAFSAGASYNTTCGRGDRIERYDAASFGYLNAADLPSGNWHLKPGSPAVGLVPAVACSALVTHDIDGRARPENTACDAGADQRRDTAACLHVKSKRTQRLKQLWVTAAWLATKHSPLARPGMCPSARRR